MVDKNIIIETITELLDANVDKETIFATLSDIDVAQGDIETCYNEVISSKKNSSSSIKENIIKTPEASASSPASQDTIVKVPEASTQSSSSTSVVPEKTTNSKTKSDKLNYVGIDDISINGSSIKQEDELKDTTLEINDLSNKHEVAIAKEEILKSSSDSISSFDTSEDNKIIAKQISELETKIDDIKAEVTGLTKIMKDILEENRNILNKL